MPVILALLHRYVTSAGGYDFLREVSNDLLHYSHTGSYVKEKMISGSPSDVLQLLCLNSL